MRALIVTNMYPTPARPELGRFVADQVTALRRTGEVDLEVFSFPPGGARPYLRAGRTLARRRERFDIVHAHYGLTLWPARAAAGRVRFLTLHGTDLVHPRARPATLAGLRLMDRVAAVSAPLARLIPGWGLHHPAAVLPAGVDTARFSPIPRELARRELGLPAGEPCLLLAADPARPEKRADRARALAGPVRLLTLGGVDPERVPLYVNAANAVLVPSDREGFGLAALEALACDVPVLATPVGIHPEALDGIPGVLCAAYDQARWASALAPLLAAADPRIEGRPAAQRFSTDAMARRVIDAWRAALAG